MKNIKTFDQNFLNEESKEPEINEGELVPASYHFAGELSTSTFVEPRAGQFEVWLNGGNAFKFKGLDKDKLAKIEGRRAKKVAEDLMMCIVKAMNENIDKIIDEATKMP